MATALLSGKALATKILDACGIPSDRVVRVSLNMVPEEVATIVVERVLTAQEAEQLALEIKTYELIERQGA